ncbi:MAG: hypothetical protein WB902_30040 [Acetobacteraceae bacterium]
MRVLRGDDGPRFIRRHRISSNLTVISLDKEAERERLSVTDQIALQDADLRKWMADRVVPATTPNHDHA